MINNDNTFTTSILDKEYFVRYPASLEDIKTLEQVDGVLGLDIETEKAHTHPKAGLDPRLSKVRLLQIYHPATATCYIWDIRVTPIENFKTLLETKKFIAHNAKFELAHLLYNTGLKTMFVHCTMLMSQLVNGATVGNYEKSEDEEDLISNEQHGLTAYKRVSNSLEASAVRYLGYKPDKTHQNSNWNAEVLSDGQVIYAADDAIIAVLLFNVFVRILKSMEMTEVYKLQRQTWLSIVDMETSGIRFDWEGHKKIIEKWRTDFATLSVEAAKTFGKDTNLASNKQMSQWLEVTKPELFESWPRTEKGNVTFTATALADYRHTPEIELLFKWKKLYKLINSYGDKYELKYRHILTDKIHTSFSLGMTATGRMSSMGPNLQQIPSKGIGAELRSLFTASTIDDVLIVADFSQIELRIQAELSGDPTMLEAFKNGVDVYKVMAASLFNKHVDEVTEHERKLGKVAMLSLGYGTGANKLRSTSRAVYDLEITLEEAYHAWSTYHKTFWVYSDWCSQQRLFAETYGYTNTLKGKRRHLSSDEMFTVPPNHRIQGTAAELQDLAIVKAREKNLKNLLAVHDEIIIEASKKVANEHKILLESAMNSAWLELFPNTVSTNVAEAGIGFTWKDAKKDAEKKKK